MAGILGGLSRLTCCLLVNIRPCGVFGLAILNELRFCAVHGKAGIGSCTRQEHTMHLYFDPLATDEKMTALSRAGETPAEGLRFSIEEAKRPGRPAAYEPQGEGVLSALPILDPVRSWFEAGFGFRKTAVLEVSEADAPAPKEN